MAKAGKEVTGDRLVPNDNEKGSLDPAAMGLFCL